MKKILLSTLTMLLCLTTSAQSAIDTDFETGSIPEGWIVSVPESPYKGGYSIVTYASESSLKTANVGTNDLGSTYALLSLTGATNKVKGNSDNWLYSPEVTIGTDNVFSFRLAANCSYSPTKEEAEKMKMDIVVIDGENQTVIGTIAPENYFSWKQYAYDLSAYNGKTIKVAFHDYGTVGSGAVGDMKYIDNIKLTSAKTSDFAIETVTTLHGQAEYTAPYTVKITNYGLPKGSFTANYSYGSTTISETVESNIASGESIDYTFKQAPSFTAGETVTFTASVTGADDAMEANNSLAEQTITTCKILSIPYSICSTENEDGTWNDLIENEFSAATSSSKSKWTWGLDQNKYHAWIYSLTNASKTGEGYLYTNKAFQLSAGKVYIQTIGTATLADNYYEVYIAKYGDEAMCNYATKVGQSEILRDVTETETIDTTTVELTIPEAGTYVIGIRPMTATKNAQMAIIGYALSTEKPTGISEIENGELKTDNSQAYNLAGQRVNANARGIIIRGGRKYINK